MTEIQIFYNGPIVKRAEAKRLGINRYFTGKPCKNGHVAQRVTKKCDCVQCVSIRNKEYLNSGDNRDKSRIRSHEWHISQDKVRVKALRDDWKIKKYGSTEEYWRQYYANKKDARIEAARRWRVENPEIKKNADRNRKASIKNAEGTHTAQDVKAIYDAQNGECVYCGVDLTDGYHVDHIMPLVLGGPNWPDNLQCLCQTCNLRKGGKHPDEWHKEIGYGEYIAGA